MGKRLSNDYRLWIESSTPGTYNEIKGQQDMSRNRASASIETSTKDNFPYGTSAQGLKTLTIDCAIIPDLPDVDGYTRLETLSKGSDPVNFQIRKGGSSGADPADVVFQASMYIGNFDDTFGQNDVVKANFQLSLEAAPTVDTLS
ncbi:MAG: hypothetical protein ABJP02_04885 [Parasphingorhabdus sp.]|uniref:hypothetical protein n=1 Tax=Parasphingorhabdus sp. TaxID=2709688 RepID=UPI003296CD74